MRILSACFFFAIMLLNVAAPFAEHFGANYYELTEIVADDMDEENKKEKEKGKEKETNVFSSHLSNILNGLCASKFNKLGFAESLLFISEAYASLPEIPPEV